MSTEILNMDRMTPRRLSFPRNGFNLGNGNGNGESGVTGYDNRGVSIEEPDPDGVGVRELQNVDVKLGEAGAAVVVRGADKAYGSVEVLSGLNMTVPCGSIYGLLGSSGCGKTTLLSCIVGLRKLNKGNIWVFGAAPGTKSIGIPGKNIGYMPQDISLYMEFTIGETLSYFGTLCGMTDGQIKTAKLFLTDLLDLSDQSRRICSLSGGQQRRISFATALIHEPELLILDEPTVGVDPILRQNIWAHLGKLVSSKRTTVIITTHYIEEARQADNIGIMRSGRLLAEKPPQDLIADYGNISLEKIVLRLCRKDLGNTPNPYEIEQVVTKTSENNDLEANKVSTNDKGQLPDVKTATVLKKPDLSIKDSMTRIKASTRKNFAVLFRNLILLSFVLWIPASELLLICITLGNDPAGLDLGVINNEVDQSTCMNVTRSKGECNVENLSCHYMRYINQDTVYLTSYSTKQDAEKDVHKGSIWGYMEFPENFSQLFYERSTSGSGDIDEMLFTASEIIIRLDESNKQITLPLKKVLQDAFKDFIGDFLEDCGYDRRQGEATFIFNDPIFGQDTTDFREYLAPGCGLALLFFFPIITAAIRYIKEKKCGMMERSLMTGITTWEIMVAYSISEFCVLLIQAALSFAVLTVLFQIQIRGSSILVAILFILSGYGGMAMGFLFGSICTEEIQAAMLAMSAFFPNFILSGLVWPVEGMPVYLQYISYALPCTFAAEATRSVISRGWEFVHPNVWPGFVVLVGYIILYFVLTILIHKIIRR